MYLARGLLFLIGAPIFLGFTLGLTAAAVYGTYKLLTYSNPKETKSYSAYPEYLR